VRVLVGCEFSGIVRDAFRAAGHDAWSCDVLPTERPGPHLEADVRAVMGQGWDLLIAFPPCTYLCRSGARWWPGREDLQAHAIGFVVDDIFMLNVCLLLRFGQDCEKIRHKES